MPGKLGRTASERKALLRNQASDLLWYGKITTTAAKAKELQPYVEKIITKAISVYDDNIEFDVKSSLSTRRRRTLRSVPPIFSIPSWKSSSMKSRPSTRRGRKNSDRAADTPVSICSAHAEATRPKKP